MEEKGVNIVLSNTYRFEFFLVFIIVRRSRRRGGEVSENSLHDKEIEDLWTIGSQPKLKRFDKQLFTVPSHSQRELNESQIGALRRAFDQPERKPAPTLDSDSSTVGRCSC